MTLRERWTRFRIWRLNRHADALLKEAEHHRNAAKMHSAASSMFWSKANDIRAAARKLCRAGSTNAARAKGGGSGLGGLS